VGGSVTSVTLRTGTNQLHGQIYEFFKNDNLNAAGWSRNTFNVPEPEFKNTTFGFTVDRPVTFESLRRPEQDVLPDHDGFLRERNPQTQLWTVPPRPSARATSRACATDRAARSRFDPLTTAPNAAGTGYTRTPFAGNTIPGARTSAVGAKAISYYPAPNRVSESVDGQNNYFFN
jgi:hypothetical protein